MTVDSIRQKAKNIWQTIYTIVARKEQQVSLEIKEIAVRPTEWVIRINQGDTFVLPKKQCLSPAPLLNDREPSVAIVRGRKIVAIMKNGQNLINTTTKILSPESPTSRLIEDQTSYTRG